MNLKEKIWEYMLAYIKMDTETGTVKERNSVDFFRQWFQQVAYFKNHAANWGMYPISGDSLNRKIPWGLIKGDGNKTIVMIHHSDTVDTEDYGKWADLAMDPVALTAELKKGTLKLDEDSWEDLISGDWIFGRGTADMKGGAAIHLALLEAYSRREDCKGNLLLIAVPDEENLSAGMRGAIPLLKELAEKHQLQYALMLNVEPHDREEDQAGLMYQGTVGKLMPVIYVRGRLAHVKQVYQGLNPINILSEIIRQTELNPEFIEKVGNTTTLPPTWLYAKDQKKVYDVSLPMAAAGYMSLLTLDRSPADIFEQLKKVCYNSFQKVLDDVHHSYQRYCEISGQSLPPLTWQSKVMLYGELVEAAIEDSGQVYLTEMNQVMALIKEQITSNEMTLIEGAYRMIETTIAHVKDSSPVVVIALTPPYYPNVHNNMLPDRAAEISEAIMKTRDFAMEQWKEPYQLKDYFTGICDLSYAMFQSDKTSIDYVEKNMLMWKDLYYIPLEMIRDLSTPVLNLGPWGKDFHKNTERVYLPDLLERTPQMIQVLIREILG